MLLVRNMLSADNRANKSVFEYNGSLFLGRVFGTLLFSWVGGTVATAPDCKSGTQETSEVRVLFCPLQKNEDLKESW